MSNTITTDSKRLSLRLFGIFNLIFAICRLLSIFLRTVLQHQVTDKYRYRSDDKRQHKSERGRFAIHLLQRRAGKPTVLHHVEKVVTYRLVFAVGIETVKSKQVRLVCGHPRKEDNKQ